MRDKKAFPPSRVASCVWSTDAVRVCTRWCVRLVTGDRTEAGGECVLVYVCIRTDLILTISAHWPLSGRQIFEDFRALRAQANFDSNFGKSLFTPRVFMADSSDSWEYSQYSHIPYSCRGPTESDRTELRSGLATGAGTRDDGTRTAASHTS